MNERSANGVAVAVAVANGVTFAGGCVEETANRSGSVSVSVYGTAFATGTAIRIAVPVDVSAQMEGVGGRASANEVLAVIPIAGTKRRRMS